MRRPRKRRSTRLLVPVLRAGVILAAGWLLFEIALWPDVKAIADAVPERTAFMQRYEARHNAGVRVEWVGYAKISSELKRAVLVSEDIEFFSHGGFSGAELRQALRAAVTSRFMPRGASTITQQLAKNLWLSPARTPRRKMREALLTRSLERHLGKHRILEVYLNVVEFGQGTFGCEAASRYFFGKSSSALTRNEAARLAAVLPRPSSWRPDGDGAAFLSAVRRIEGRIGRAAWLAKVI